MNYRVVLTSTAEKQLKKLPKSIQSKIAGILVSFEIEPKPFGCKKLTGFESTYRYRVGDYRIIYEIINKQVIVTVLKIAHRKDVYR